MAIKWRHEGMSLGEVSVAPGQVGRGGWKVAPKGDGSYFEVPVMICCGDSEGPVLWVQGCIHGDEYASAAGIVEAFRRVDPVSLRGALLAIPVLNISAFLSKGRCSPQDNLDMNRVFPGDPKGTHTWRVASRVFKAAQEKADCLLDMHGYRSHHMALYFKEENEASDVARGVAMAAGTDAVVSSSEPWLAASLCAQLTKRGIPSVIVEAPGGGRLDRENIDHHCNAITNIMKHLGMIEGDLVPPPSKQFICNTLLPIPAPTSGLVLLAVRRGDRVHRGQLLARMIDVYGDEMEQVTSPVDGMVLNMDRHGLVMAGEPLFMLGEQE